ncbi:hypothetical protein VCHENC02_1266 [Vibrio harveyi]|uniref:Uncharacterized protein n=1 Tax=Vibrio harveyi TaxID=669 RepID=A0A454D3Q1_VIBHA|nr:hypothetical protein VCHENC02_1266 [Vibrio harveyi]
MKTLDLPSLILSQAPFALIQVDISIALDNHRTLTTSPSLFCLGY